RGGPGGAAARARRQPRPPRAGRGGWPRRRPRADRLRRRPRRGALRPRRRGGGHGSRGGSGLRPRSRRERPSALHPHARRRGARGGPMKRVAVVGGGLAGLAAALRLVEAGRGIEVLLLEAKDRLGGTIASERTDGFLIEVGADAFFTEKPWAQALCERAGLGDRLIGTRPGDRRTYVVHGGRLVALPEGFVLLAPTDPWTVAASPLFSWRGKLRMLLDLVLPRKADDADESLSAFVRRRLGREALERLVQPLIGGIYTADPAELSLKATLPQFLAMEREHGSLIRAARRQA